MYFIKSPILFDFFYPGLTWRMPEGEKKIYITFDDGPEPSVTPKIIEILEKFKAKATFFCVGKKAEKSPGIVKKIKDAGHSIGNHTYHHMKGKEVDTASFLRDISMCDKILQTNIFRPPYGSIKRNQIKALKDRYQVFMWTVLPGDFDPKTPKEKCLQRSIKNSGDGTIIVFHDNEKTQDKVLFVLPKFIEYFQKLGFTFEAL